MQLHNTQRPWYLLSETAVTVPVQELNLNRRPPFVRACRVAPWRYDYGNGRAFEHKRLYD